VPCYSSCYGFGLLQQLRSKQYKTKYLLHFTPSPAIAGLFSLLKLVKSFYHHQKKSWLGFPPFPLSYLILPLHHCFGLSETPPTTSEKQVG